MFQKVVLTIAVVILILTLVIIGVLLYNKSASSQWPPEVSSCPDYYTATSENVCQNTGAIKVSNANCNTGDFSGSVWKGKPGEKRKCQWARDCGVAWDGISNASPAFC
jgi:hypothetical protein